MNAGTEWIDQARRVLDALRAAPGDVDDPADVTGTHASDCRWCPVCQVAAVVRGERPELTAALADVLTATAAALRAFAAETASDGAAPADSADAPAEGSRADGEEPEEPPAVQRIEIA
ncbi:MAG: uncharacterized protein JWQ99_3966 [Blastococcus sp.]|jgi:hypothetical protein|nr:uncharacterized protein [Blastococcus sp.]